ncbi:hypothetical protein Tco_0752489 [Tanacetum coccineum]|uniref:Uncharacterized protein n=1 Tax=Tanacetum coccineum TaxID=301880 RepID=A0ABQ4Z6Z2_9ASTR
MAWDLACKTAVWNLDCVVGAYVFLSFKWENPKSSTFLASSPFNAKLNEWLGVNIHKINIHKSNIYGIGVNKDEVLNEVLSFKYWGQLNIDVNEDTCTWSLGHNGTFTVKDARYRIDQNILPTLAYATTWDKSIPRK